VCAQPGLLGWWVSAKGTLRRVLEARIDNTLWIMCVTRAPPLPSPPRHNDTGGARRDSPADKQRLSTITLLRRCLSSNSQMLGFLAYLLNLYMNASWLSMLVPLLIFLYAGHEAPRAPKVTRRRRRPASPHVITRALARRAFGCSACITAPLWWCLSLPSSCTPSV
jgi:hypothetical protein